MLKIQAKRLDIYFGGSWNTEMKSFQLTDLQGQLTKSKDFLGKPYSTLKLSQNGVIICAVETRDGFEENRLKILLSLLKSD